jgi:protein involved in polysaccharide export with SLBB domain
MKNNRIVQLMINYLKNRLLVMGCVALIVMGCAQTKSYDTSPGKLKSDGLAAAGTFRAVVIDDLDGDGNLDVVGGASNSGDGALNRGIVTINYGDGKGGISEPQILPVKAEVRSVAVADFNEDGLNDIVFSVQKASFGIRLWMNQSRRQWKGTDGPIGINNYQSVKAADVNSDGHMDIIAANMTSRNQGGIQVWLGDGKGGWLGESGPTIKGRFMDVAVADFNGDQALDLVGAGWGTFGALKVWLGDGAGHWSTAYRISEGSYYGISMADINGDGNLDLLAGSYRAGPQIFLGDGRGSFMQTKSPADYMQGRALAHPEQYKDLKKEINEHVEASFWTVLPFDFDADGRLDILASSANQRGIVGWQSRGENRWKLVTGQFPSSGTFYEMTSADLNSDGYPDICAASGGEGIKIWPGKAGVSFTARHMEIEQLTAKNRLAALEAPLENNVYATIDGVAEYKIGPGDILEITLWNGNTPTKEEIPVHQDGKISFGFVEDLAVKGLTISQFDDLLTRNFKEYVRKPRIDVVIKEYNSKSVTMIGAINDKGFMSTGPGNYKLTGKTTLIQVVTRAGGPTRDADLNNIVVRRRDGRTLSLDLFKAIQQGKPEQDFILDDGDIIFVPTYDKSGNRVYVFGEVEKPGAYDYAGAGMRLFDAISDAGGTTIYASQRNAKVVRGDPTRPEIISADLKDLVEQGDQSQNVLLASGDLVYVPRSGFGEIRLFNQRIRPLFEMILWPARTVIDWYNAADIIKSGGDVN